MSIDLSSERPLSFQEALEHLPRRRGKLLHLSTLYRWADIGVRGVKLEIIKVGGATCTTLAAIQRFCQGVTDAPRKHTGGRLRASKARQRRANRAARALDRAGI